MSEVDELGSTDETLHDGHAAADAEGFGGHAQAGRGLVAFPFVEIDAALHPAHGGFLEAAGNDLVGREVVFDVEFEDAIEDLIRRQGVLVLLVRPQFGARRFVDACSRG